jgi:hypothetical protein
MVKCTGACDVNCQQAGSCLVTCPGEGGACNVNCGSGAATLCPDGVTKVCPGTSC